MKKITFILFALIAGTSFAQTSQEATATSNAEIVAPLEIVLVQNLDFGLIASDATGANSIVVSNAGTRTNITGVTLTGGTTAQQAIFQINAGGNSYSVTSIVEDDLTILGGGTDSMVLTLTNDLDASNDKLSIGGKLDVKAGQAAGSYQGEVKVTVAYN